MGVVLRVTRFALLVSYARDTVGVEHAADGCPYYRSDELGELARTLFIPGPSVEIIPEGPLNVPYVRRLPCHTAPLPDHEERFHRTDSWRDPPIAQLCCLPTRGCFRAVFDDRVKIDSKDDGQLSVDQRDADIVRQVKDVLVSDLGFDAEVCVRVRGCVYPGEGVCARVLVRARAFLRVRMRCAFLCAYVRVCVQACFWVGACRVFLGGCVHAPSHVFLDSQLISVSTSRRQSNDGAARRKARAHGMRARAHARPREQACTRRPGHLGTPTTTPTAGGSSARSSTSARALLKASLLAGGLASLTLRTHRLPATMSGCSERQTAQRYCGGG
jgi:hypothetical protein